MKKKILAIQGSSLKKIDIKTDTSFFLGLEAQRRNYEIFYYEPKDLSFINGKVIARCCILKLQDNSKNPIKILNKSYLNLVKAKALLIRNEPPFNQQYINTTFILEHIVKKLKIINDPRALREVPEKLFSLRFIEFMPFDGNQWKREKTVSYQEIMEKVQSVYSTDQIIRLQDAPNDTSKNYTIQGHKGTFAIISTVTNPFCDQCNRVRLTANGKLKNCLFSQKENDLLIALRNNEDLEPIIRQNMNKKFAIRSGMESPESFEDPKQHLQNRSMITIGG